MYACLHQIVFGSGKNGAPPATGRLGRARLGRDDDIVARLVDLWASISDGCVGKKLCLRGTIHTGCTAKQFRSHWHLLRRILINFIYCSLILKERLLLSLAHSAVLPSRSSRALSRRICIIKNSYFLAPKSPKHVIHLHTTQRIRRAAEWRVRYSAIFS